MHLTFTGMTIASDDYGRMAKAINYIRENFKEQPRLEEVAARLDLSPFHFQRLFTEWAGVSPKKFLQFLTLEYSKNLLRDGGMTLFDAAHTAGLSGTGRLHDLFVTIEGMTPAEFKSQGKKLHIAYSFRDSVFGRALVASTTRGICYLAFTDDEGFQLQELKNMFPFAAFSLSGDKWHEHVLAGITGRSCSPENIRLHLRGTPFQLKVWNALLKVQEGALTSYGKLAGSLELPGGSRAVGSAVGANPVAFLIPCHRVIRSAGTYGEYRWGATRKELMIGWEAARKEVLLPQNE